MRCKAKVRAGNAMAEHSLSEHIHHGAAAGKEDRDWLKLLAIGTTLAAGAVIISPYILPLLGGNANLATQAITALHGGVIGGTVGSLAEGINAMINAFPVVGPVLAQGGLASAAATGIIGIGGVLLGRYIDTNDDGTRHIRWGKLITAAAITTSALIALPTALTGISVGLTYLVALAAGTQAASLVATALANSIGSVGAMNFFPAGLSGIAAVLPHLLTCGVSLLPAALSISLARNSHLSPSGLSAQKYSDGSVTAEIKTDAPLAAGKPCSATLTLRHTATGLPLSPDELAVVHTEKIHLFVADSSLKDYHHIHPQPTGEPGVFSFGFTPNASSNYAAWADFTLLKDNHNHKLKSDMPAASRRNIPAAIRANSHTSRAGLTFHWQTSDPLRQNAPAIVEVAVTDAHGRLVNDLEPVMGAFAHLVGFSADGKSLIHTHPYGKEPVAPNDRGNGRLRFHIEPDCSGAVQFYLQIRRNNEDVYVPFGQHIAPPLSAAGKITPAHHRAGTPAHITI